MELDPELENYYNTYFDLFQTEGWQAFQEDVKEASETIQLLLLQDAKELHFAQGQLTVFHRLLNWENAISNAYDSFQEEAKQTEDNG
jgi:hypothetical protein